MCGLLRERNAGWNSQVEPALGSSGLKMVSTVSLLASPTVASIPLPSHNTWCQVVPCVDLQYR